MKTLGVIANCQKPCAPDVLRRLAQQAGKLGLRLVGDAPTSQLLGRAALPILNEEMDRIDALLAMGGDGTMLRAVRELGGRDKLVIGVNLGSLGFLTSVTEDDLEHALDCFCRGEYSFTERAIAECVILRAGREMARYRALNEVGILSLSARVIALNLMLNGEEVSHFVGDGLIVSTPTGSTGHSLSAGGPVVCPGTRAFLVTLICPHTLSTRPLVVPDDCSIQVTIARSHDDPHLTVDGQVGQSLMAEDQIEVRRSARGIRVMHLPDYSYFAVLRQKLHWRGSSVESI